MGVSGDEDPEELKIIVNGEKETVEEYYSQRDECCKCCTADEQVYFTFATSAKMPIILRMKNGFYIALKEIKTK